MSQGDEEWTVSAGVWDMQTECSAGTIYESAVSYPLCMSHCCMT